MTNINNSDFKMHGLNKFWYFISLYKPKLLKMNKLYFLLLLGLSQLCNAQNTIKPNIVLINIDDLGWRDLEFMGTTFYKTPNIDRLAKKGMQFSNAYAAASNCAPSRASLFTGQWASRHGIYTVGTSERGKSENRKLVPTVNNETLGLEHLTISQYLKNEGYNNCHAGKWHLGEKPLDYGFDMNIGGSHAGNPGSYYPPYKNVDLKAENGEYLTDLIMEKTILYIDTVQSPFFLNYAPYAVHTPIQGVKELEYKYQNIEITNGQKNIQYATMIENLDRNIGLLIESLEKKGVLENTLIILTSDNGGLIGVTSQEPLRGGKGTYYEGGIRVPLLFVWQGQINEEIKSDIPVSHLDIFPTIVNIISNNSYKIAFDGENLLPILNGTNVSLDRPLFWHFPIYLEADKNQGDGPRDSLFRTRPGSVVRIGDWKLHHYFEDDGIELYNLKEDIGERNNLSEKNPNQTKWMLQILEEWRKKVNAPIPSILNPEFKPVNDK